MDLDARHDRERGKDIAQLARAAAGATRVDQSAWRMIRETGSDFTPLAGSDFIAYELKKRNVRRHPYVHCRWDVRLGPNAHGALSKVSQDPMLMPPAAHKVSPREFLVFLQNPDQAGNPVPLNTDACLGFSIMAYQASESLSGPCVAAKFILVRLSGPVSTGHDAPKHPPTQRGKVGYCSGRVAATHVAAPGAYCLRPYDELKHTGLRLWSGRGPWAPRRFAAIDYALRLDNFKPLHDSAAKSSEITPPLPLIRGTYRGAPPLIPTVAQANAAPPVKRESEPEQQETLPRQPVTKGPLRLETLIPRDEDAQPASSSEGIGKAAAAAVDSNTLGLSKGKGENPLRGEHLRGLW